MRVLSLGWGVQSFTLAVMAALGDIEPVDAAIHADTTHESSLTYDFAGRWTVYLEERGVKVATVKPKRADPTDNGYGQEDPPYYTLNNSGRAGQGKRQCTTQWKITPIRRWLQANRNGEQVTQLIGISTDEWHRMKDSGVKYITNSWPLIEKRMSRKDCEKYLSDHGIEIPHKSACYFCPYHSSSEWRLIKENAPDWNKAVSVDRAIRGIRKNYNLFVHPARKPLEDIDFRTLQEKGQTELWDAECSGMCGI